MNHNLKMFLSSLPIFTVYTHVHSFLDECVIKKEKP